MLLLLYVKKLKQKRINNLILICLKLVIFVLEQIKSNLSKIKFFMNNKRTLIFENIYAIFASFQIIFTNIQFMFDENFNSTEDMSKIKETIIKECYKLILNDSENHNIPLAILVQLISFITMNNSTKKSIAQFQQPKVYKIFLKTIENFSESDIKYTKFSLFCRCRP